MAAYSFQRGWSIVYIDKQWIYADTNEPISQERQCRRCNRKPTPEGHDACLGVINSVKSACCGHGIEQSWQI